MKSLLNQETKQEFINRINKLTPETKALWGVMTVDQMLKHCQIPLALSIDKIEVKPNKIVAFLFGKRIIKSLTGPNSFKRNLPTFKEAKLPVSNGFEAEKKELLGLVNAFEADKITKKPHPAFGPMTQEQWEILQTKHLDHHLNQFGV